MDDIKKDQTSNPHVSDFIEIKVVLEEYKDSKFEAAFVKLGLPKEEGGCGYKHVRKLRRDGNCFYRAYLFQIFEHYALSLKSGKCKSEY